MQTQPTHKNPSSSAVNEVLLALKVLIADRYPIKTHANLLIKKLERLISNQNAAFRDGHHMAYWLTEQLQSAVKDLHLRLDYRLTPIFEIAPDGSPPTDQQAAKFLNNLIQQNYGIECVKRLRGNIGFIEFRAFAPLSLAKKPLEGAMAVLADTSALIIDLRSSRGGHSKTVHWLISHMIEGRQELIQYHYHSPRKTETNFSDQDVPKYFLGKPISILTSPAVLSAGEELTYLLKHLVGALVVGERTAGGAHAGIEYALPNGYTVFLPVCYAVDPRGGPGWEGVGIEPDIQVECDEALKSAHEQILKRLIERSLNSQRKRRLQWEYAVFKTEAQSRSRSRDLKQFIGQYGPHRFGVKKGRLFHKMYGWYELLIRHDAVTFSGTMKHKDHLIYRFKRNHEQAIEAVEVSRVEDGAHFFFPRNVEG